MSQMCPNCSFNNPDEVDNCVTCSTALQGLLGEDAILSERYKVISVLGYGAMGAVYLAKDSRLVGRRCAIKENRPAANANVEIKAQSREQFLAEASILARLDHPNLPKVSDFFIIDDREYLVMDYIEGEDLDSRIQRAQEPINQDIVVNWADQVLDALAYLHDQKPQPIVHRDIKPANIRVNMQDRVRLVDFGLVKVMDSQNMATKVELRGLGTPAYAPLEQFADSESHTDPRSDVYSLGATMYHLLTHLYPPDVHQRVLDPAKLIPPHELNASLSPNVEQVILKAMSIHPDERYQTAQEMRQALVEAKQVPVGLVATAPVAAAVAPPAQPAKKSLSGGMPIWVASVLGVVAVLLVLILVAYFVFGPIFGSKTQTVPPTQPAVVVAEPTEDVVLTATPTESVVQSLGDAPTDTPTIVVEDSAQDSIATEEPTAEATEEPTAKPIEEATTEPIEEAPPPPQGLSPASLVGTIAYSVFNGESYDLYLGQADGSGTQYFQGGASQPAFSPDGSRIAFHSWQIDSRGLIAMDLGSGRQIRVASFFEDQLPTWSVDGSEIILLSRREGDRKSRLYRVSSIHEGDDGTIFAEGEYPSIGPGGQLVFRGWGLTAPGLRLAAPPYDNFQPLTDSNEDNAPVISPDGQKVAFMSKRDGNWEIYVVNIDGSSLQRLTETQVQEGIPAWSPDGQAIAFASDRDGVWAIWAMAVDGSNQQQLFVMEGSLDGFVGTDSNASRGWVEERLSWKR